MISVSNYQEDVGDLAAKPGSASWCIAVRRKAQCALEDAKHSAEQVQTWIKALQTHKAWQTLQDRAGRPFRSFEEFCKTNQPEGLGYAPTAIDEIIAERKAKQSAQAKAADPEIPPIAEPHRPKKGDNITLPTSDSGRGSTGSDYIVRRLKRDAPEVADALARGEYTSARAAGIAAGIVKVPTPYDILVKAWNKASKKEKDRFMTWANEAGW